MNPFEFSAGDGPVFYRLPLRGYDAKKGDLRLKTIEFLSANFEELYEVSALGQCSSVGLDAAALALRSPSRTQEATERRTFFDALSRGIPSFGFIWINLGILSSDIFLLMTIQPSISFL